MDKTDSNCVSSDFANLSDGNHIFSHNESITILIALIKMPLECVTCNISNILIYSLKISYICTMCFANIHQYLPQFHIPHHLPVLIASVLLLVTPDSS